MPIYRESKTILLLATPLIIGQIGQMLLGLVDSIMIAKLGVTELAALTLANNLFYIPFVFGIGILTCISVKTSTAHGAGNAEEARSVCRNGIYLALFIGIIFFAITASTSDILNHIKQDTEVATRAHNFYLIIMASLIPTMIGIALKNHADSLNRVWTAFWISIAGVLLNILLNWILIYGNLGAPQLNLEGAGIATLISRIAIVLAMLIWFAKDSSLQEWTPYHWLKKIDIIEIKSLTKIGIPSGLQMLTEVGAFVIAGIIIGSFGKEALAAQNIAMVCVSIAFMIPLGISIALTMHIGQKVGQRDTTQLHKTYLSGWLLTFFFSVISALIFILFNHQITQSFIDGAPAVTALASSFLIVAGIFQIVDGQQVVSVAMLRGLRDTNVPAIICFTSYWIIGIPFGCWLAYSQNMGPVGIWWGLAMGLTVASILLGSRLWRKPIID